MCAAEEHDHRASATDYDSQLEKEFRQYIDFY